MKRRFSVGCGVAAALLTAAPVWAQASPAGEPASPVRASASVDRTAVWVGDHVTYTVEIACARGFDALLDDLAKDKLHLQGFEVIGSDSSRTTAADGSTTYDVRFLLTTYQVGAPSLSVAPFSVRYYAARPGERAQDQAPAGDVQVPGVAVALRSTLPEGEAVYELRDRQVLGARGRLAAAARPIGLALVLLSLVPAVAIALAMARRGWQSAAKRSAKRARTDRRVLLAELGALDVRTDASRRVAYDRVSSAVREHVQAAAGIPAPGLTATEIAAALSTDGRRVDGPAVAELLASCDSARYGPDAVVPDLDACRRAIARAEEILSHR